MELSSMKSLGLSRLNEKLLIDDIVREGPLNDGAKISDINLTLSGLINLSQRLQFATDHVESSNIYVYVRGTHVMQTPRSILGTPVFRDM